MPEMFHSTEEKKVEYIELIYDLIFVYLISRNNSLLHTIENGFVRPDAYFTFLGSTLVILQLWYFSVMLYVVFTFMAFLIVAGLFSSYGFFITAFWTGNISPPATPTCSCTWS